MSSFKKINYSLRPAKAVERKMMSFAFKKLNGIVSLSNYQYVGFGSTSFHDFTLFHTDLGINDMTSIERSGNERRFQFNKPFDCINLRFGDSNQILPGLNWDKHSILWLDYDKGIKNSQLQDISTFVSSARSGSALVVSLCCEPDTYGNENNVRRDKIIAEIGEDNLHFGNHMSDFSTNSLPISLYKIMVNRIKSVLLSRNSGLSTSEVLEFKQLFHFVYSDGLKMLTLGGVLLNSEDAQKFDNLNLHDYKFIETGEKCFQIDVPPLTTKEIRFLNSLLPNGIDDSGEILSKSHCLLSDPNLTKNEILKYSKIYNFFPNYTEALSL